ncbi:hypothetical protein CAPTEDRAFT_221368 [Capitella teleta]|uniref:INO80 complex subunit E N-terminal domain-containing protein n=1 Tax=Capitella teleta TaxID=283909 RepID=R7UNX0_CAPTE|nr:hypothetical protein CAPTEDRAFT_221368 [Capitella teleta]|eukprot:ELU07813.1 hypothetical protein CAPTEDRAFT_221368 [Capitella teleta]
MFCRHQYHSSSYKMMPGYSSHGEPLNYKKKYTALKRKLKLLVYEQECFVEELKKSQRKLLKVTRDRTWGRIFVLNSANCKNNFFRFLLDRLCQYEKTEDTSSDSDSTASSDSEAETNTKEMARKKKMQQASLPQTSLPASSLLGSVGYSAMLAAAQVAQTQAASVLTCSPNTSGKGKEPPKKKAKVVKKTTKMKQEGGVKRTPVAGQMTREELERHLELKTSSKPQFMSIDKAPHSLPEDIFSHDNSNPDSSELLERIKSEEEADLIIDVPH